VSERPYVVATGILAVVGTAIAGYLTYVHFSHTRIACPTSGCETVQSSSYSDVFGVPVALLGLTAYVLILAALLVPPDAGRWFVLGVALAGLVFSTYLVVVQAFQIGAFCLWCLASDFVVTLIAAVAFLRVRAAEASVPTGAS
jgi:uncharacterized membrane protein